MQCLLVVDIQNDFLPGGALAVPDGDLIIPVVNRLMERADIVVASQDWHPADHASFASQHTGQSPGTVIDLNGIQQILWPDHCVQHTPGASFAAGLGVHNFDWVIRKGDDRMIDSYSAFFDNDHKRATGLEAWLRNKGVTRVAVCGLATDYCVKFTVLDAIALGFETSLIEDATRAVNLEPEDGENAIATMRGAGAAVTTSAEFLG